MNPTLYVGSYTSYPPAQGDRSEGLFLFRLDRPTGRMERILPFDVGPNPSFLTFHPTRLLAYVTNEEAEGGVSAFISEGINLRPLNSQPVQGADPCHLTVDPSGRWLLVACYSSGSLSVLPILEDGGLGELVERVQHEGRGPNAQRQEKAHVHSVIFDPSGQFVLSADLGLDKVFVYQMDPANGKLREHGEGLAQTPGAGPRHLAFHPNGRFLYISNELDSTVSAAAWDAESGHLRALGTLSTLPEGGFAGENTVAELALTPSGEFLYVSNRGDNSLAAFCVDGETGLLERIGIFSCGGNFPRHFAIDPETCCMVVANQLSQDVVVMEVNSDGSLTQLGKPIPVPAPVCVRFFPKY